MGDTYCRQGETGASTARLTAAGSFITGVRKLYWLTVRPGSADWSISLDDSTDGTATTKWDIGSGGSNSAPQHLIFDPPMEFTLGIYLEAVDHITSCTACYL